MTIIFFDTPFIYIKNCLFFLSSTSWAFSFNVLFFLLSVLSLIKPPVFCLHSNSLDLLHSLLVPLHIPIGLWNRTKKREIIHFGIYTGNTHPCLYSLSYIWLSRSMIGTFVSISLSRYTNTTLPYIYIFLSTGLY